VPWKDKLCREILSRDDIALNSLDFWRVAQGTFPSVRVKTTDARGSVVVIQLADRGQWMKPREWAFNHQASVRQRTFDELRRYLNLVGPPRLESDVLHFLQLNNIVLPSTRRDGKSSDSSALNPSNQSPAMRAYTEKQKRNSLEGWEEHFKNL